MFFESEFGLLPPQKKKKLWAKSVEFSVLGVAWLGCLRQVAPTQKKNDGWIRQWMPASWLVAFKADDWIRQLDTRFIILLNCYVETVNFLLISPPNLKSKHY